MKKITLILIVLTSFLQKSFSQVTYPCGKYFIEMNGTSQNGGAWNQVYNSPDITLAAWIQLTDASFAGKRMDIFNRYDFSSGENTDFSLAINESGQVVFKARLNDPTKVFAFDSVLFNLKPEIGKWYHIAVTFDGTTYQCNAYVNAELANSKTFAAGLSYINTGSAYSHYMTFGLKDGKNAGYSNFFKGYLDEAAYCQTALTASQVKTLATGLVPGDSFIVNNRVAVYHKFDDYPSQPNYGTYRGTLPTGGQYHYCQASNKPPIANAGADQTITLPTNSVTLDGSSSSDPDGSIVKYEWSKTSGPSTGGIISNPQNDVTSVTGLNEGMYVFRLTVTDNKGATSSDEVQISVKQEDKYITIANLRVYADNIPNEDQNPRTISGNVYILPGDDCGVSTKVLHFNGDVIVDTVQNTISGEGAVFCSNVGSHNDIYFPGVSNGYLFNVINDELYWNQSKGQALKAALLVAGLGVEVNGIEVLCDGVKIKGKLGLPRLLYILDDSLKEDENSISIDSLYLTSKGIDLAMIIKVKEMKFRKVAGFENAEFNYNSFADEMGLKFRAITPLVNVDAGALERAGALEEANIGLASKKYIIPLPGLTGWGIDSAGGAFKNISDPSKSLEWEIGARFVPLLQHQFPVLPSIKVTGSYELGSLYKAEAECSMFDDNLIAGGEMAYSKDIASFKLSIKTKENKLISSFVNLKGSVEASVSETPSGSQFKGSGNLSLGLPEFPGWLGFINKLYPDGNIFTASSYLTNSYLALTIKKPRLRVYGILQWSPDLKWDFGKSSSIIPLEAQAALHIERRKTSNGRLNGQSPTVYSFQLGTPTDYLIVQGKGKQLPILKIYFSNGDTLTTDNYTSHKNVQYIADTSNAISTFIISNPLQGTYYIWSGDGDSLHVTKMILPPEIFLNKVSDDKAARKLIVSYDISDQGNGSSILFGLDQDKEGINGYILTDSIKASSSNGSATLDYSKVKPGNYYLYSMISDGIGQFHYQYYNKPINVISNVPFNDPSDLVVTVQDSVLIFNFRKNNSEPYNYLIHYTTDTTALTSYSDNIAIGDTNEVEIANLIPGKTYQFAISAMDTALNESSLSNIVSVTWQSKALNNYPTINKSKTVYKVQQGSICDIDIPATDPDNDMLEYTFESAPKGASINNNGNLRWLPKDDELGYNHFSVKVDDNKGGIDSVNFDVLVYDSVMSAPWVNFNNYYFDSYNEKGIIEINDPRMEYEGVNEIEVKISSTSDPLGVTQFAVRSGGMTVTTFLSEIGFSKNLSTSTAIKVASGDTVLVQYKNPITGQTASNYFLFNYLKADFLFRDSICGANSAKFYNASKGSNLKYEWDFGDSTFSNEVSPEHTYSAQNSKNKYIVKLKITNGQNTSDTISKIITLEPTVVSISTSGKTNLCSGDSVILFSSASSDNQWYRNDTLIAGATQSYFTVKQSGEYSVIVTQQSCPATSTAIPITVLNKPKSSFSFDSYCLNLPVSFTNTTSGNNINYVWSFGDNQTTTNVSPQHTYSKTGTYAVSLITSLKDCPNSSDTLQKTIKIEAPVPGIKYPLISSTFGRPQQLTARNIGKTYQWIPPTDLDNAKSRTPVLTPTADRKYAIQITMPSGCITIDSLEVVLLKDINVFVPTAFAPNGNGSNDLLRPILLNITSIKYFRVYNRWGQLVYETKTINEGWNGNYQGKSQPMETYTWIFEGTDIKGNPVKASGKSVLMR